MLLLVRSLTHESTGVLSVELVDPDGAELPTWRPNAQTPALPALSYLKMANGLGGSSVTYGAISKIGAADAELTMAVRMIKRAQALKVLVDAGQDVNAPQNLRDHMEFVNLMRSFYEVFGRNF